MPRRTIVARLDDILSSIAMARRATSGKSVADIYADEVLQRALERAVEIVSEASRHIPEADQQRFPEIPWRNIKTIGNVIRHEYAHVDQDVI